MSSLARRTLLYHIVFDVTAFVFLFLLICSKVPVLGKNVTKRQKHFGDLYELCAISYFKYERLHPECEGTLDDIDSADVIIFGDSFIWIDDLFWCGFKQKTGKKTALIRINDVDYQQGIDPLSQLNALGYRPTTRKILVWERVERAILFEFPTIDPTPRVNDAAEESRDNGVADEGGMSEEKILNILKAAVTIDQKTLEYCFVNFPPLRWFISQTNTLRFFLFRELPELTPKYVLNPPMLFFKPEVDSFNSHVSDEDIRAIAGTIEKIADRLDTELNIQLVFMPVPDKYVVYGDLAGAGPYSGLVPRLVEELGRRQVPVVDLYPAFMEYRQTFATRSLLYYPSDTHWNGTGINLAVDVFIEFLGARFPEMLGRN